MVVELLHSFHREIREFCRELFVVFEGSFRLWFGIVAPPEIAACALRHDAYEFRLVLFALPIEALRQLVAIAAIVISRDSGVTAKVVHREIRQRSDRSLFRIGHD